MQNTKHTRFKVVTIGRQSEEKSGRNHDRLKLFVDNCAEFTMQTFAVDKIKTATGTEF
jgi:hypothetical protein